MFDQQKELAQKAFYAMLGAPFVVQREMADFGARMTKEAKGQFAAFTKEGEKVSKKLRGGKMMDQLSNRVDLEQLQDRVEKVRDQLEGVLDNWREGFAPAAKKEAPKAEAPTKPAAKKPAARKTTAKATASKPAAKKPAAKKPAAKKPAAKKPAAAQSK